MEIKMPNNKIEKNLPETDEYDEITDEDYGFVVGPDGDLKSVFLPVVYSPEIPDNVRKIFKIFGVDDIDTISDPQTKH